MAWKESLGAMRERLLHHVRSVADTQYKEGAVHERVKIFNVARFAWWQRGKTQIKARVLVEASEHEVTAREFSQAAAYRTRCEICELTAAYEQALDALQRIVDDEPDPMEIAAVALDKAEARLARFGPERTSSSTFAGLDVKLNVDTSKFRAELAEMEEKLRAISAMTGPVVVTDGDDLDRVILNAAKSGVVEAPPLEPHDAVPFETQNEIIFPDPMKEPVGDLPDLSRQAAPDDN